MPKIITYNDIQQFFEENNCKLLTKKEDYQNVRSPLIFRCHCGSVGEIQFRSFKNKKQCKNCSNCKKYTHEEVKKYFEENNCVLLTTKENYFNVKCKVDYICSCGNRSEITFDNFKHRGVRCSKCVYLRR